jgi:protein TonB
MATESRARWPLVLAVLAGIGVLVLIGWAVSGLFDSKPVKVRKQPTVTLLPDKPPPPPPPKEEKPPPPKDLKEAKIEPPKMDAPQPAPNEPLKMEGAAGDGDGPFAAGSVSSDYVGGNVGLGGMQQGLYASRLQRHLQEQLSRNRRLREADYRIVVRLWLRQDGSIERAELGQSTGNESVDGLLRQALMQMPPIREAPPDNVPQPWRIRITSRGA